MIWDLQASAGAAGQSILWRGTWSSATSYNPYDAVYGSVSSYISKTNNQNKNPASNPSDWDLLAAQGPEGPVGGLPVGTIIDYAGLTEPTGWLFCFGQSLPTTGIYADLFGVLAYAYGGSGGNFNLPDFRGRVGAGRDNMGGVAANRLTSAWSMDGTVLGANGGTESHVLTTPQIPSHTHSFNRLNGTGGAAAFTAGGTMVFDVPQTGATGGGLAHPNCQPTLVVNRIIKYSSTILGPITPGTGNVVGPDSSVDGDMAVFVGTTGKQLQNTNTLSGKTMADQICTYNGRSYRPHGVLFADAAVYTTSGTGEQTIYTYVLPANSLTKAGDILQLKVNGQSNTASTGARTQRLKINGTTIFPNGFSNTLATTTETVWAIARFGTTGTRQVSTHFFDDGGSNRFPVNSVDGATVIDYTAANTFSVTVQAATGAITLFMFRVELFPAP